MLWQCCWVLLATRQMIGCQRNARKGAGERGASTNATVPNAVLIYAADPLPFWPICLFAQVPLTFLPLVPFCHWPFAAMYQKPLCPKCRLRHLPLCTKCLSSKCLYSPLPFGDKCPYETNAVQGQMPFWFKGNWEYKILTFMLGKHWFKRYITREAHMCNCKDESAGGVGPHVS